VGPERYQDHGESFMAAAECVFTQWLQVVEIQIHLKVKTIKQLLFALLFRKFTRQCRMIAAILQWRFITTTTITLLFNYIIICNVCHILDTFL
jgi:hypothetical protein